MTRLTIAPLAALALAACNQSSVSLTNATPAEVAKAEAAAGDIQIRPGQWETNAQIIDVQMPGVPAEMRDMLAKKMEEGVKVSSCVTPDQVKDFDPGKGLDKAGQGCTYSNYTRSGGRLSSTLVCTSGGHSTTITSTGTYTATSFTGESSIVSEGGPGGQTTMKSRVTARRTGDCTAEK